MTVASRRGACAVLLALAWALCTVPTAAGKTPSIETAEQGDEITVTAFADMQVDARTVWSVISDYDHLAEFIPDMRSSRVIQRDGDRLLVEQRGEFGFLFFLQPVQVRLVVVESPQQLIVAHAVAGNLREMEGRYAVEKLPSGEVRLSYSGRLVPEFPVPPLIGRMQVKRVLARQFTALVKEIHRRDALVQGVPPPASSLQR
jgi:hypothetical protein